MQTDEKVWVISENRLIPARKVEIATENKLHEEVIYTDNAIKACVVLSFNVHFLSIQWMYWRNAGVCSFFRCAYSLFVSVFVNESQLWASEQIERSHRM